MASIDERGRSTAFSVRTRRISLFGHLAVALLLTGSIASLQVLYSERDPVSCLSAYALVAIALLIAIAATELRPPTQLATWASALFFGYLIVRALTSPVAYAARADLYLVLATAAVYAIVSTALVRPGWRIGICLILLTFAAAHVVVSVVQAGLAHNYSMLIPSLSDVEANQRGTGLYVNPDHLAGLLELLGILGLAIACWSRWPRWSKVLVGYLVAVCYFGIGLTGSRGGYLSALASFVVFGFLSLLVLRSAGSRAFWRIGGGGVVLLAASVFFSWALIQQSPILSSRAANVFTIDKGRLELWQAAIEQWKLQPWIGTGSGTYLFYGRQFRAEGMRLDPVDVHNDYLHLLCEYGVLGGLAFLFLLFAHLRAGWQSFRWLGPQRVASGAILSSDRLALNIGAFSALGAYAVHSAVDFNLHIPANALPFAFVFACLANPGISDVREPRRQPSPLWLKASFALLGLTLLIQCARLLPGEYNTENARVALREGYPAATVVLAERALAHDGQNPRTFFYLGRALFAIANQEGQEAERPLLYERAIAAFGSAHRLAPLDASYPLEIAFLYDELGRFAEAEWMFGLAREREPRSDLVTQLYATHLQAWENSGKSAAPPP